MNKIGNYINIAKQDENLGKRIFALSLLTALFLLALVLRGPDFSGRYIVDDSGSVVGIQRKSLNQSEEYELSLSVTDKNKSENRKIKLRLSAVEKDNAESKDDEYVDENEIDNEINQIVSDIEYSNEKKIKLPSSLSNGAKLKWKIEKQDYSSLFFIPLCYLMLVGLIIKSSFDSRSDTRKENKREIMKALPRFTNQLMLMMNAGMILNDAFERICVSYSIMRENRQGYFEKSLMEIYERNMDHRISTADLINEFAVKNGVKELIRISTILTENERRGSDVIDNLSRESRYLWDERKITARECGKLIDTKMTYPLGILLILLIVITMAPAILSM